MSPEPVVDTDLFDSGPKNVEPTGDEAETVDFEYPLWSAVYVELRTSGGGGIVDRTLTSPVAILSDLMMILSTPAPSAETETPLPASSLDGSTCILAARA